MTAPLLLLAIGNASRGDDALGPVLAAQLRAAGAFDSGEVELMEVYQLQVEDTLALQGRRAVLFIDAARGAADSWPQGVALRPLRPASGPATFTHALAPAALLALVASVWQAEPPPAWLLAIEGAAFELGSPLSAVATARLPLALEMARAWLATSSSRTPLLHAAA